MDERFHPHLHPALPGRDGRVERLLATRVHAIDMRSGEFGKGAEMLHAFRLHARWPALVMTLGTGDAGGEQFARTLRDERLIFTMGSDDHAQLPRELQRLVEFGVVDAEGTFVGEEDFEGADAARDDLAELDGSGRVEFRHAHVEGEIARRFSHGLRHPQFEAGERVILPRRAAHLDERGGAADQRGLAAGHVGVLRIRAHERQVDVDVGIDEAGEDQFARGVDDLRTGGRGEPAPELRDRLAFAENVAGEIGVRSDDPSVLDEQRHGSR